MAERLYIQETKGFVEKPFVFEPLDELYSIALADFRKKTNQWYPKMWYYTFQHDDYENMRVTLFMESDSRGKMFVSALEPNLTEAIEYIKKLNKHLIIEEEFRGYNADDFICNRKTAKLIIKELIHQP